jgi:hypothetical protein
MKTMSLDDLERTLRDRAARRPKAKPAEAASASTPAPIVISPDAQRLRAFEYYEFNVGLPVVEQSPRARKLREVARLSTWHGWGDEITRALDREGVRAAGELSDAGLDALGLRLRALQDSKMNDYDPPVDATDW